LAQAQPQKKVRKRDAAQLLFLNVTPLPENSCSTSLFTTGYKRLNEGGLFDGGGFLMGFFFLAEGRIAEGKRIVEGELPKGNC
jgi:hypothetical protein